ncbi:MAG: autotransporter-associated beta strand repeat-containing protein, partial [Puniceicoccales bacterium]|nr:autotransporter-associated beta strand repeat-containing protein [Puniceicoccales bacterium]
MKNTSYETRRLHGTSAGDATLALNCVTPPPPPANCRLIQFVKPAFLTAASLLFVAGGVQAVDVTLNSAQGAYTYNDPDGTLTIVNGGRAQMGSSAFAAAKVIVEEGGSFWSYNSVSYISHFVISGNGYSGDSYGNGAIRLAGNSIGGSITVSGAPSNAHGAQYAATIAAVGATTGQISANLLDDPTTAYADQLWINAGVNGGTVSLTGDNSGFTGDIYVRRASEGSDTSRLQIGYGGTTGNLDGDNAVYLQKNTGIIFNRSNDITFAGTLANTTSGPGSNLGNGTDGRLYKHGAGTLVLTGNSANFTGATNVVLGTLQIGNATGSVDSGFIDSVISLAAVSTKVVFDRETAVTYAKAINGSGAFEKKGDGTLTLSAANGYTGTTSVSGGVLAFGAGGNIAASTAVV